MAGRSPQLQGCLAAGQSLLLTPDGQAEIALPIAFAAKPIRLISCALVDRYDNALSCAPHFDSMVIVF